jgi:hypothetical protein
MLLLGALRSAEERMLSRQMLCGSTATPASDEHVCRIYHRKLFLPYMCFATTGRLWCEQCHWASGGTALHVQRIVLTYVHGAAAVKQCMAWLHAVGVKT